MTTQANQSQEKKVYSLTSGGIGLNMYDSSFVDEVTGNPKKYLAGSDQVELRRVTANPFTTKKGVAGLTVTITNGYMGSYTNKNGEEKASVQIPKNKEERESIKVYLYEQSAGTGFYTNKGNDIVVKPVEQAEDGSYRPAFNIQVNMELPANNVQADTFTKDEIPF